MEFESKWFTVYMVILAIITLSLAGFSLWGIIIGIQTLLKYLGS